MAQPILFPRFKAFVQGTNAPLSGGQVFFYIAGTSTPQNTYTDATLTAANTNPVILDSNGEASIWPAVGAIYKIVVKDSLGVTQSTTDNWSATATALSISGHNYLMNGGFELWQTATSFVGAAVQFLCDGWAINQNFGAGTVTDYTMSQQASGRAGSKWCLRIARNAASVAVRSTVLVQNIETIDAINLQTQQLVVSFWLRAGANYSAGPLSAQVVGGTGTDESFQTALAFTGGTSIGASAPITPTTSWVQYTFICAAAAANVNEAAFILSIGASSGTAGAADYLEIDDVQVELGITATPFERETADVLLRRCQRRYYKTFPQPVAPATNGGLTGAYRFNQVVGAGVANQLTAQLPCPAWMRQNTGSAFVLYNPSAANNQIRNVTLANDCASSVGLDDLVAQFATFTTSAGSAAGNQLAVHYAIDHRI